MFVVALSVSALLLKMMSLVDNTVYLEKKTIAHWVALNQMTEMRLKNQQSNQVLDDEISGDEEQLGRRWYWRIKPIKTADKAFVQLRITVYESAEDSEPLLTLTSMADRYHR